MSETRKGGPGKYFREGLSLKELFKLFPDDAAAEAWFIDQRWPGGATCPHCGHDDVQYPITHKSMTHRCRADGCRKRFSVKTGTAMQCSKVGYQDWAIALYLMSTTLKGTASMKLYRELEVTQKTAWHLAHRIREGWSDTEAPLFDGPAEMDESYFGGKARNKHAHQRTGQRGTAGKTIVAGVKDRASNRISAAVVESRQKRELQSFVADRVELGSVIYTDDLESYRGLPNHQSVNHSVGEYVRGQAHVNGMESFWAMMKRGYYGTYHRMSPKHLNRYVNEFAGRHNARCLDTIDQMVGLARGLLGKRLRYRDLIRRNGRPSGAREITA